MTDEIASFELEAAVNSEHLQMVVDNWSIGNNRANNHISESGNKCQISNVEYGIGRMGNFWEKIGKDRKKWVK